MEEDSEGELEHHQDEGYVVERPLDRVEQELYTDGFALCGIFVPLLVIVVFVFVYVLKTTKAYFSDSASSSCTLPLIHPTIWVSVLSSFTVHLI